MDKEVEINTVNCSINKHLGRIGNQSSLFLRVASTFIMALIAIECLSNVQKKIIILMLPMLPF
ncbi:hypothetical protein HMPREF1347_00478 [Enterococcus faecium 504]|nr:hypothetical protein HMPREF1347_00478 [Enterococcus faecium 504]